jgi:hypothetical protein
LNSEHNHREPIQLDPPKGTNDGLLIHIDDGSIVAESVSVPYAGLDDGEGRRTVVGHGGMGTIEENGESSRSQGSEAGEPEDKDERGSTEKGGGGEDKPLLS